MKVQELLDKKSKYENKIKKAKEALNVLVSEEKRYARQEYSGYCTLRTEANCDYVFTMDEDFLVEALNKEIEHLEFLIEPINKKLDVVELILNS